MKKSILLIIISITFSLLGFSQENKESCNCVEELELVSELVKQSKSYKGELSKSEKEAFLKWKDQIKSEIIEDEEIDFYCVGYLNKLISFIPDAHNQVYQPKGEMAFPIPQYDGAFDSLANLSESNQADSFSGIYYQGSTKVALIQKGEKEWIAVALSSKNENWQPGSILFRVKQKDQGYEMFEFNGVGQMIYRSEIEFKNNRIYPSIWNQDNTYFFYKKRENNFEYKVINDQTDYIAIGTFARTYKLMRELGAFYDSSFQKINKPNLVIDLRNNGGGSILQGKALVKFIKQNPSIKTYVMVNAFTGSAAELITLRLQSLKNVVVIGENTRGALAYGYGNAGLAQNTACGYKTLFTVKKSGNGLIQYERKGISPKIYLDLKRNWIEQIAEIK